ncbi:hypothetical protein KCU67_g69, partial [Aureobasidium melanogenum]
MSNERVTLLFAFARYPLTIPKLVIYRVMTSSLIVLWEVIVSNSVSRLTMERRSLCASETFESRAWCLLVGVFDAKGFGLLRLAIRPASSSYCWHDFVCSSRLMIATHTEEVTLVAGYSLDSETILDSPYV